MLSASAIRTAIYNRLAGTRAITDQVSERIFHAVAPAEDEVGDPVAYPLIVFHREPGGQPVDAFQGPHVLMREAWLVKCVDQQTSSTVAETVQAAIVDAMEAGLTVAGAVVHDVRYLGPVDYPETGDGRQYRHHGARFRVVVSET